MMTIAVNYFSLWKYDPCRNNKKKIVLSRTYSMSYSVYRVISDWSSDVVKVNGDNIITRYYYIIIMTQVLFGKNHTICRAHITILQLLWWQSDCYAPYYYHTRFILFYSVFVPLDGKQRWRWKYFPVMNLSWLSKLRYIIFTVV